MSERLPLFPLENVVFPGVVLPLHIFEPRYRALVGDLAELPESEPRQFGVVAIRDGREVGAGAVRSLFDVGCTAELGSIDAHDDGRYDVVATGVRRFRLLDLDPDLDGVPYLRGVVEYIEEPVGAEAELLIPSIATLFGRYQRELAKVRGMPSMELPELPEDPTVLSYLVAAAAVLQLTEKQQLLSTPDSTARLRLEASLLRREIGLLKQLPSLPATDLLRRNRPGR